MHKTFNLKASLLVAAMLALPAVHAETMSKDAYNVGKTRISADFKTDKVACKSLAGNARDVCMEEAKAKEKVANAELKYAYSGKAADHNAAQETKAETAYSVAKEKCDDKAGNDKSVCLKEAKAVEVKALVDARVGKKDEEARADGMDEKRDADYKVAAQKCDDLAGDAKNSCISSAKARYGKTGVL